MAVLNSKHTGVVGMAMLNNKHTGVVGTISSYRDTAKPGL